MFEDGYGAISKDRLKVLARLRFRHQPCLNVFGLEIDDAPIVTSRGDFEWRLICNGGKAANLCQLEPFLLLG